MATYVPLQNERTGEIKRIKVGWSWTLFFFSSFFGLPLFLRGMTGWGTTMLIILTISVISQASDPDQADPTALILSIVQFACVLYLAVSGNKLTGKRMLERGWTWADPDAFAAMCARDRWSLADLR